MRVQLKFRDDAPAEIRTEVLENLEKRGAGPAVAVFPNSTDRSRQAVYMVDAGSAGERRLLRYLKRNDAIEIAEPEVRRRLAAGS